MPERERRRGWLEAPRRPPQVHGRSGINESLTKRSLRTPTLCTIDRVLRASGVGKSSAFGGVPSLPRRRDGLGCGRAGWGRRRCIA